MEGKSKNRVGRPTIYSTQLGTDICQRLAEGESLRAICRDDEMPDRSTVVSWAIDLDHEFSSHYAQARIIQAEVISDEILDIVDDGANDWVERTAKNGEKYTVFDHEHVSRSKLRADARQWYLSRIVKRFRDKVDVSGEITVSPMQQLIKDVSSNSVFTPPVIEGEVVDVGSGSKTH